jgi:hypothetical protein
MQSPWSRSPVVPWSCVCRAALRFGPLAPSSRVLHPRFRLRTPRLTD